MNNESIYKDKGFKDRDEYLESLCEKYDSIFVYALADIYGPSEDFDGLLTELEESL